MHSLKVDMAHSDFLNEIVVQELVRLKGDANWTCTYVEVAVGVGWFEGEGRIEAIWGCTRVRACDGGRSHSLF